MSRIAIKWIFLGSEDITKCNCNGFTQNWAPHQFVDMVSSNNTPAGCVQSACLVIPKITLRFLQLFVCLCVLAYHAQ